MYSFVPGRTKLKLKITKLYITEQHFSPQWWTLVDSMVPLWLVGFLSPLLSKPVGGPDYIMVDYGATMVDYGATMVHVTMEDHLPRSLAVWQSRMTIVRTIVQFCCCSERQVFVWIVVAESFHICKYTDGVDMEHIVCVVFLFTQWLLSHCVTARSADCFKHCVFCVSRGA